MSRVIGLASDFGIIGLISETGAVSAGILAIGLGILVDPLLRLCLTLMSIQLR